MPLTADGRRIAPQTATEIRAEIVQSPAAVAAGQGRGAVLIAAAVWLAVGAGVGVRAYGYARNPSLWIDEAMLALNVIHRTPAELLQPLDLNQGAPVGFLLSSKLMVKWFGPSEYALRFLPFLAGMLGFAAFVPLAYQMLPLAPARLAVVLFALSPYLAGYCAEFKQYGPDAAVAAMLMLVGLPVWRGTAGPWRVAGFALAGAAAVWVSHPAAFVLGGIGTAALADAIIGRDRDAIYARLLAVGCWAFSFGVCFLLFTRKLGMNQYLLDYWAGKFMPFPPKSPGDLAWVAMHYFELFQKPGGLNADSWGLAGVAGLCFLVGAAVMARTDWRSCVALVGPVGLCLMASAVQKYPFAGRLMLFAVPGLLLVTAFGAWQIADRLLRDLPVAAWALVAILVGAGAIESYWLVSQKPLHHEEAREALADVWNEWQDGDRLYVSGGAAPAFAYYHPRFPLPTNAAVLGSDDRNSPQTHWRDELKPLAGNRRVWVVAAHLRGGEDKLIRAYLDGMGRCDRLTVREDAVVLRYDLSGSK